MGVPSYFSYIIKQHRNMVKKRSMLSKRMDNLYMDCNSLLYDSFHKIDPSAFTIEEFELEILNKTIASIESHIRNISPEKVLFIAFDGVAPFAKMEQQRNRRYKTWFESEVFGSNNANATNNNNNTIKISSSMFTPGTKFMKLLSVKMKSHFLNQEKKYDVEQIILATPDEAGEGEHKLFAHLRENPGSQSCTIYGLDADLIMLSLFHLTYSKEIYVFREAPEFLQLAIDLPPNENVWFLDIVKLAACITNEMACSYPSPQHMYDYVFLCFFLGNDFLPHFPSLNIRTHGMQRLLDTYRMVIGNKQNCFLVHFEERKINWSHVGDFIVALASMEHEFFIQEYNFRKKWDNKTPDKWPQTTLKEKEECFKNTPVIFRADEKYIAPDIPGWEDRYYNVLFDQQQQKVEEKKENERVYANSYLDALEWVFQYYTSQCPDWHWHYHYSYPPLLRDLAKTVRSYKPKLSNIENCPVSPEVQLAYVLPKSQHFLLEKEYAKKLETNYAHFYPDRSELKFKWAFCRYFWESHICLPEISIKILSKTF